MSNSVARRAHHSSRVPLMAAANATTTSAGDTDPKTLKIDKKAVRRAQNEELLKNKNVQAFLQMTAKAEGGDYHAKFGWVRGKDAWTFSDESTHPGVGKDGHTTAAGLYQINRACWTEHGIKSQGLVDFSPHTQDLIAVDNIRSFKMIQHIVDGEIKTPIKVLLTRKQWTSFGVHKYETLEAWYKAAGGTLK
ncbi:hypothetical protein [Zoogloea sp. LCSB751]|uniref:hypothetical protein n=1 Tax=Zoogloea sp. LCSB751 TaxID=1965277 RepID=UPI001C1FCE45|nr:hypothetical protein [Zoogloea sp. LCSB751]